MNPALLSSTKMDWQTPQSFLHLVRQVFRGRIGLDPATSEDNPTNSINTWWAPLSDGLQQPWTDRGSVFVNPPYGRGLPKWVAKMDEEARNGAEIIALIPSRTDTRWWQNYIARADSVCFWRGRIRFVGAPASAPFPSVAVYWGRNRQAFDAVFGERGWIP